MSSISEILVLVAGDKKAALYASNDGVSRLLRQIDRASPMTAAGDELDADSGDIFACALTMALGLRVREQDCDGVIIFADAPMMGALHRARTRAVERLILAEIVGEIAETCCLPGFAAAHAPLACHGGLQ
jgi:hypothetical protein